MIFSCHRPAIERPTTQAVCLVAWSTKSVSLHSSLTASGVNPEPSSICILNSLVCKITCNNFEMDMLPVCGSRQNTITDTYHTCTLIYAHSTTICIFCTQSKKERTQRSMASSSPLEAQFLKLCCTTELKQWGLTILPSFLEKKERWEWSTFKLSRSGQLDKPLNAMSNQWADKLAFWRREILSWDGMGASLWGIRDATPQWAVLAPSANGVILYGLLKILTPEVIPIVSTTNAASSQLKNRNTIFSSYTMYRQTYMHPNESEYLTELFSECSKHEWIT